MINRLGAMHFGVWAIKHIVSPFQRWLYQLTDGKFFTPGDKNWPQLLQIWPAYQEHFSRSGQRAIFVLEQALPEKPGS